MSKFVPRFHEKIDHNETPFKFKNKGAKKNNDYSPINIQTNQPTLPTSPTFLTYSIDYNGNIYYDNNIFITSKTFAFEHSFVTYHYNYTPISRREDEEEIL